MIYNASNVLKGGKHMNISKKNFSLVWILVVAFFLIANLGACKSEQKMEEKAEEKAEEIIINKEMLTPIFGEGGGSASGILDAEQTLDELQISYYLFTEDISTFDDDIERELAPKIPALYEKLPEIDNVLFTVNIPQMGEPPYKPYVSFAVTRKIVEETEWSNLLELEFFDVVMDVKYYD
jgi:hypothetical protein